MEDFEYGILCQEKLSVEDFEYGILCQEKLSVEDFEYGMCQEKLPVIGSADI